MALEYERTKCHKFVTRMPKVSAGMLTPETDMITFARHRMWSQSMRQIPPSVQCKVIDIFEPNPRFFGGPLAVFYLVYFRACNEKFTFNYVRVMMHSAICILSDGRAARWLQSLSRTLCESKVSCRHEFATSMIQSRRVSLAGHWDFSNSSLHDVPQAILNAILPICEPYLTSVQRDQRCLHCCRYISNIGQQIWPWRNLGRAFDATITS